MSVANLIFKLPEEQSEHRIAVHALDWALCVNDISGFLRDKLKYGHEFQTIDEALQACREYLLEILEARGVSLEDIA